MEFSIHDPHYNDKMTAATALYNVIDPELFINIMDLGLVYDINFDDEKKIVITMTLTTKHCPLGDAMKQGVNNVLGMAFPEREAEINVVWEPEWTLDSVTPEGKRQLGME